MLLHVYQNLLPDHSLAGNGIRALRWNGSLNLGFNLEDNQLVQIATELNTTVDR